MKQKRRKGKRKRSRNRIHFLRRSESSMFPDSGVEVNHQTVLGKLEIGAQSAESSPVQKQLAR